MGTSLLEPFRILLKPSKTSIKMPKGAGLTKPMKLSTELADIVGKKEASRAECIKQLWAYIKKNNLQDPENKQFFVPTRRWPRSSETTASGLSAWPSSSPHTCPKCLKLQSTHSWLDNPILRWLAHLRIRKEISAQFSTQPRQRCLATLKYLIHPCL